MAVVDQAPRPEAWPNWDPRDTVAAGTHADPVVAGGTAGATGGGFCVVVIVGASLDAVPGMPRGVWALG